MGWESTNPRRIGFELAGFILLLCGTFIYKDIIIAPGNCHQYKTNDIAICLQLNIRENKSQELTTIPKTGSYPNFIEHSQNDISF